MRATRVLLGLVGIAVGGYGVSLLLGLGFDNLVATVTWVVGGIVLHDGLVAFATIALGAVLLALFRGRLPAPVVVGGVVLGSVTIAAIPVLGRFGERPDNATLLDRDYVLGWVAFAGLTFVLTVCGVLLDRRRSVEKGGEDGTGPGRR